MSVPLPTHPAAFCRDTLAWCFHRAD